MGKVHIQACKAPLNVPSYTPNDMSLVIWEDFRYLETVVLGVSSTGFDL